MAASKTVHQVSTYNLLSEALCESSEFSKYPEDHIDVEKRWERIAAKLRKEMDDGAIVALQEVSQEWASRLFVLCAEHGDYMHIWRPYGNQFSNFMGVGLLIPTSKYKLVKVRQERVGRFLDAIAPSKRSDARASAREDDTETPSIVGKAIETAGTTIQSIATTILPPAITNLFAFVYRLVWPEAKSASHCHPRSSAWGEARMRHNCAVYAALEETSGGEQFAVASYHMPCCFAGKRQSVMTLHTWALTRLLHQWREDDGGIPLVLGGDFNFKPDSPMYRLLSTGSLLGGTDDGGEDDGGEDDGGEFSEWDPRHDSSEHSPAEPDAFDGRLPRSLAMQSAYKQVHGREPEMTNYNGCDRVGAVPFVGTLDFVWLTDELEATGAPYLSGPEDTTGPFPSETEPSDHVLVRAAFRFRS